MGEIVRNYVCKNKDKCIHSTMRNSSDEEMYITDKFSMLCCCKKFWKTFNNMHKLKTLMKCYVGKRFFVKFESFDPCLSSACSQNILPNQCVYFTNSPEANSAHHFGFILNETMPFCQSKFPNDLHLECYDITCNYPHLRLNSMMLCLEMCCISCDSDICPSKKECSELFVYMFALIKLNNDVFTKNNKKFIQLYKNFLKRDGVIGNIPDFIENYEI